MNTQKFRNSPAVSRNIIRIHRGEKAWKLHILFVDAAISRGPFLHKCLFLGNKVENWHYWGPLDVSFLLSQLGIQLKMGVLSSSAKSNELGGLLEYLNGNLNTYLTVFYPGVHLLWEISQQYLLILPHNKNLMITEVTPQLVKYINCEITHFASSS